MKTSEKNIKNLFMNILLKKKKLQKNHKFEKIPYGTYLNQPR
jgi:hypothetical protein